MDNGKDKDLYFFNGMHLFERGGVPAIRITLSVDANSFYRRNDLWDLHYKQFDQLCGLALKAGPRQISAKPLDLLRIRYRPVF